MRKKILNYFINNIRKENTSYTNEDIEKIRYGLEIIYILVTKSITIFTVAYLLGLFKEVFIFTLIYNVIRMPSFGLHATKSWICFVSSLLIFIGLPYLCNNIYIPFVIKIIVGVSSTLFMWKYAPADTYKRPIINPIKRRKYKIASTIISILMVILSVILRERFISNAILFSLVLQCFIISPYTYQLFHLPYNNYKKYIPCDV